MTGAIKADVTRTVILTLVAGLALAAVRDGVAAEAGPNDSPPKPAMEATITVE